MPLLTLTDRHKLLDREQLDLLAEALEEWLCGLGLDVAKVKVTSDTPLGGNDVVVTASRSANDSKATPAEISAYTEAKGRVLRGCWRPPGRRARTHRQGNGGAS